MKIDRHADTWVAVEQFCKAEIERARDALERAENPETRGRIKAFRDLLALAAAPAVRLTERDVHLQEYSLP